MLRVGLVIMGVLCVARLPATAYAKAPSNAHLRFRVGSTLNETITGDTFDGTIGGFVYWTPGKSRTRGVWCCRNTVASLGVGTGGTTTKSQFPITMRLGGVLLSYKITSRDARGSVVGSAVTDPTLAFRDAYVDDFGTRRGKRRVVRWALAGNHQYGQLWRDSREHRDAWGVVYLPVGRQCDGVGRDHRAEPRVGQDLR